MRLWAAADLLLTPNGAHFVNAIFMREHATLLEGVPWAMRAYVGAIAIVGRASQVHSECTAGAQQVPWAMRAHTGLQPCAVEAAAVGN